MEESYSGGFRDRIRRRTGSRVVVLDGFAGFIKGERCQFHGGDSMLGKYQIEERTQVTSIRSVQSLIIRSGLVSTGSI